MSGFDIIEGDVVIRDSSGNPVGVVLDGAIYRLQTETKLATGHGLATEATLLLVKAKTDNLDVGLSTRASETTLAAIKNVDGVKKIADPLPAGTNSIGAVTQGTKGAAANGWPVVLYDASGNPLAVSLDGGSATSARGIGVQGKTNADLFRYLLVEDDGKLSVATSPPTPPPGTTEFVLAVNEAQLSVGSGGDVTSPHDTDSSVIANGLNLFLQIVAAGTEGDPAEAGSKVEVYWVEGAGATEHLIERIYLSGETVSLTLPDINSARDGTALTGNGTNTFLRVRRTRFSNAAQEVDFGVRGYTE